MNIYEKLNGCRCAFQDAKVPKRGVNKYAGYTYFELDDILGAIVPICDKFKVSTVVTFHDNVGELHFIDLEKDGTEIVFQLPMSTASLKGCHEVQNLGAVVTYLKRYLYQNAFEIAEQCELDATLGQPPQPQARPPQRPQQPPQNRPQPQRPQPPQENIW